MSDDLVTRLRFGACALEIEQAADRIEELEAKLEALDHAYDSIVQAFRFEALRTNDAETKLAMALEALRQIVEQTKGVTPEPDNLQMTIGSVFSYALMTLAELKGQKDE
jgi:cell division septum initiation protein DivIVA